MKFLVIAPRFHTNLYYRVKSLQDAGHQVKVLVLYKGKSEFYEGIDIGKLELSFLSKLTGKIIRLFKKNYLKTALEFRLETPNKELRKQIKNFRPDAVLLKAYQNALALKTLFWAKRCKSKVFMLTQTTFTHIKGSTKLFKLNILLFKKMGVHAYITPILENYEAFKKNEIENVYYVPFVFPEQKIIKYNNKEIKIISIGKFVKRKDHLLLLKSILELSEKFPVKLTIFGEKADKNYYDKVINFIKENKLKNIVKINLNISYNEILKEYSKHDIFVLPSYAEPAAYSIVEAMANGLPVICSDQNGTKFYIKENENGYIFKAQNSNDLTQKLTLFCSDRQKISEMSKKSIYLSKKNHNPVNFSNSILKLL